MRQDEDLLRTRQHAVPRREQPQAANQKTGALLRGLGAVLRRYTARNERLQVCETLSLGGRRSVALIECDGQRFLAGMSASGVETLVPVGGERSQGDSR
ncbi:flagellar biosynthetic protein FliO [Terriglobus sp.]|uniref:flagellar biosynthetic protein FliO n=1 Tax=Terriglobus sp. TaxID=1889013 RepID=UPI003B00FEAA